MNLHHERGTWIDPKDCNVLSHEELQQRIQTNRVILLGETHTSAEIHRWQLHMMAGIFAIQPKMLVGYEMFPRRVQGVLDEWTAGELEKDEFLEKVEWGKVWGHDSSLYMPLFDFCRQKNVRMLGINCRRDLVTQVGKEGWEAIPEDERDGLTPAKPASQEHKDYLIRITGGHFQKDYPIERFARAQQTWDRAFACNIAAALKEDPTQKIIGIIGRGHLEYGYGTPYQLADLGIDDVLILLPSFSKELEKEKIAGIGDGLFRLDSIEG